MVRPNPNRPIRRRKKRAGVVRRYQHHGCLRFGLSRTLAQSPAECREPQRVFESPPEISGIQGLGGGGREAGLETAPLPHCGNSRVISTLLDTWRALSLAWPSMGGLLRARG